MSSPMHIYHRLVIGLVVILSVPLGTLAQSGNSRVGKTIYERLCVGCHGKADQGSETAANLPVPPRNLANQALLSSRSDDQLFAAIKHGGPAAGLSPAMPAFGAQLRDQDIWDLVAYIRRLAAQTSTPSPAPGSPDTPTSQDGELKVDRLRLSIWPEYDDPRVLIMFRGEISPRNALPTQVTLPIPRDAEIIGAGMVSEQNELLLHPYNITPAETHDRLELTLPVPHFFLELYYDPFGAEAERQFTYTFSLPYAVERLEVDIQKPRHASDFTLTPASMRQTTDDQGLTYHLFSYRDLRPHEVVRFTVTYTKIAPGLSAPPQPPQSARNGAALTPGEKTLLAVGLLAGATVLLGGGVMLWKRQRRRSHAAVALAPQSTSLSPAVGTTGTMPNFCALCGRKLQPSYHFCPGCGKALHQAGHEQR